MAKRLTDDEIMDYTYNKLFGDLDGIRSGTMFSSEGSGLGAPQDPPPNAGTPGMEGINITLKPIMKAAAEGGRPPESEEPESEEEEDSLKGIGKMSPLMSQLHGDR